MTANDLKNKTESLPLRVGYFFLHHFQFAATLFHFRHLELEKKLSRALVKCALTIFSKLNFKKRFVNDQKDVLNIKFGFIVFFNCNAFLPFSGYKTFSSHPLFDT